MNNNKTINNIIKYDNEVIVNLFSNVKINITRPVFLHLHHTYVIQLRLPHILFRGILLQCV